jgi:hypothetical protein
MCLSPFSRPKMEASGSAEGTHKQEGCSHFEENCDMDRLRKGMATRRVLVCSCTLLTLSVGACSRNFHDSSVRYKKSYDPNVKNGHSYSEAFLPAESVNSIVVPTGTRVEYSDEETIRIIIRKSLSVTLHPRDMISIDDVRHNLSVLYASRMRIVHLAPKGTFAHNEGGALIDLALVVPHRMEVFHTNKNYRAGIPTSASETEALPTGEQFVPISLDDPDLRSLDERPLSVRDAEPHF